MQTQRDRIIRIMDGKLGEIKLGDKCKAEASGPQIVMAPDPSWVQSMPGEQPPLSMQLGWQLVVWLEHDRLIGQDPIGVSFPIGGMLPPEMMFARAAELLLTEARKVRFKANHPELEQPQQGEASASQPLPPGLVGKQL